MSGGGEELPLAGLTVVVTRAQTQASVLVERLAALGAHAVPVATIKIVAPLDGGEALRSALCAPQDQIVVASPNGARALLAQVLALRDAGELDAATLPPVACVGPTTAAIFDDSPLRVNVVGEPAVAEGLVASMPAPVSGSARLLLAQAEVSRDVLEVGLAAKGWLVDRVVAYRAVDADVTEADRIAARSGDVVTFMSSSTLERFVRLVGRDSLPPVVATIGPITSATAESLDVPVTIQADPHTADGLIDALCAWAAGRTA